MADPASDLRRHLMPIVSALTQAVTALASALGGGTAASVPLATHATAVTAAPQSAAAAALALGSGSAASVPPPATPATAATAVSQPAPAAAAAAVAKGTPPVHRTGTQDGLAGDAELEVGLSEEEAISMISDDGAPTDLHEPSPRSAVATVEVKGRRAQPAASFSPRQREEQRARPQAQRRTDFGAARSLAGRAAPQPYVNAPRDGSSRREEARRGDQRGNDQRDDRRRDERDRSRRRRDDRPDERHRADHTDERRGGHRSRSRNRSRDRQRHERRGEDVRGDGRERFERKRPRSVDRSAAGWTSEATGLTPVQVEHAHSIAAQLPGNDPLATKLGKAFLMLAPAGTAGIKLEPRPGPGAPGRAAADGWDDPKAVAWDHGLPPLIAGLLDGGPRHGGNPQHGHMAAKYGANENKRYTVSAGLVLFAGPEGDETRFVRTTRWDQRGNTLAAFGKGRVKLDEIGDISRTAWREFLEECTDIVGPGHADADALYARLTEYVVGEERSKMPMIHESAHWFGGWPRTVPALQRNTDNVLWPSYWLAKKVIWFTGSIVMQHGESLEDLLPIKRHQQTLTLPENDTPTIITTTRSAWGDTEPDKLDDMRWAGGARELLAIATGALKSRTFTTYGLLPTVIRVDDDDSRSMLLEARTERRRAR